MANRPVVYLDEYTTFNEKQTKKINDMIRAQYSRFTDRTTQKPQGEDKGNVAVVAQSGRVHNCSSFEYNGTGFASFQLMVFGMVVGQSYQILGTKNKIEKVICYGGSSYVEMYDDISDWGYFYGKDNVIYFKLTRDPNTLLYPYCNVTWTYKEDAS